MKRAILNLNGSSKRTNITIVLWIIILLCLNGFQNVYSQTYGPPVFFDDFGVVPAGQNVNSFRGNITGRGTIGNSYWYWPETCTGTGGWLSQSVPSTEVSYDIVLPEAEDGVTNWVFVPASTSTNGTDPYTSAENINNPNNLWCWSYNTWTKKPINCTGKYSRWYLIDGNWRHGHWERLWYKKWETCSDWHNGMDDGGYALTANPDYTHGSDHAWLAGPDHTPGDENGMMLVVNAAFVKGLFYKRVIPGLCYGSQFEFKAYYANILSSLAGCKPGIPINIRFEVWDKDPGDDEINSTILVGGKASNGATLIAFNNTGDIPGGSSSLIWHENKLIFDVPQNQDNIVLILRNNGVGGCGNDLAIDDISFRPYMPFSLDYETNIDNYCLSGVVSQKGIVTSGTVPVGGTYYYQWQEATEGTTNWTNLGKPASSLLDVKITHNIRELGDKIYRVISSPSLQNLNNSNCYVASSSFSGNSIKLPTATISGEADVCGTDQHTPVNASFTINYHGNEFPWTYYYRVNDGPELSQIVNGPAITDTKSISVTDDSKVELLRIVTDECSLGLQLNSIHNITYSVGKPSVPNTILGPNPACIGDVAEFSIQEVPGVISYNWVVSSGWEVISGQGTPRVKLKIGNTPIYVLITTENACGTNVWTSEVFQTANLSPDAPELIYAPKGICMPSTETGFTDILFECSMVNGASNYIWDWDSTVSMGTQENGTGQYLRKIVLSVPNRLSTFNVRVRSQNACGYSAIKEVTINTTRIPQALAGNDRIICSGSETNIGSEPVAGNMYKWTSIPPGFISSTANPVVSPLTTTTYVLSETNVSSGCSNTNSIKVTVEDLIKPTITAPDDVFATTNSGCISTNVNLGLPTITDNCSVLNLSNNAPTDFPLGQTIVTWTVTDGAGLTATATQRVTIVDNVQPISPTLADVTVGECSGTPITPMTTDNCSGPIHGTTTTVFPITTQGTTVVTWTFDDGHGNVTTANQNVILKDVTAPVADITDLPAITGECSAVVTAPTATDNCKEKITATTTDPLTYSEQGIYTIHWTYDDGNGNKTTASQNVIVKDITAPVPDLASLPAITGECSATVTAPTATDNCKDKITATTTNPLTYSEQGIYTIHWRYDDGNDNISSQEQTVIVKDITPPEAPLLADVTVGECSGTPITPMTTDNCSGPIHGTTTTVFPITTQGTTVVTWTFDDGNGNATTTNQNVIVANSTAPVPDIVVLPNATGECSVTVNAPQATKNCEGKIVGTTTDPLTYSEQGNYTIHWTYDDDQGNIFTQTQSVIVDDITAPVPDIAELPAIIGECSATATSPTATDNCKDKIIGTTPDPLIYSEQGNYTIHWNYDDGHGNLFTQTQSVVVDDTTPPETPVLADVTVGECSGTPITPMTTDNCSGPIHGTTTTVFPITTQGTTVVTWTFDDLNGNVTTANQNVIVKDVTAPVPDVAELPAITGECSTVVTAPTATDNCKDKIVGTTTDPLIYSEQGKYTIHWTYNDGQGNISTQTQSVVVDDITPPEIPVLADVTVGECSGTPITPMTTDNCSGPIHGTTTTVFPITTQGTTVVTWTFDDGNGNVTTANQKVIVANSTAPVPDIVVLPNATGECSVTVNAPLATKNCEGKIVGTTTDPLTYSEQGNYTIHWTYDDDQGNIFTQTQSVIVDDITAPVPDIAELPAIIGECSATATSPTATDNCKDKIVGTTTDPLTYSEQGIYTIHWNYDDGHGNLFTQTQSVVVDDITPPEIPVLADVTVGECSGTPIAPTTMDVCKGTITGSTTTEFPLTTQGPTVVTWTFDDLNGNVITANQNVIVKDITAPVPDLAILPTLTGQSSITVTAPAATDNCNGSITGTTTDPLTYSVQGNYLIHWIYDDGNGNTSTQTQSVVVDDTTPPETPVLADVTVGECSGTPVAPTTTDNSYGVITGTTLTAFPITVQGVTIVTWTFDDSKGNITTANQNVIVKDVTAPIPDVADLPAITDECFVTVTAPTATDNCKGKITAATTDPLTYSEQGIYTIHWTYDDGNGNTSTQTQSVVIDDTTPPEAPVLADVYLGECSGTPPTPTAMDNCSGIIKGTTSILFPKTKQGRHTIIWTFDDGHGNQTTAYQNLILEDKTAPVPDLATLPAITSECSATVTAPTATDNCKGKIPATTTDPLTYSEQGIYTIHWIYDDGNGNTSTQTQSVVIDDITPPEAPVLADVYLGECSGTPPTPTAMDNCSGIIKGTTSILFPKTKQGRYTIIWTFDDGHGNVATAYQNLILEDKTAPVPDLATLPAITAECSAIVTAPAATDNCKGKITATTTDPLAYSEQGIYTIHWTYEDGNGNTSTQTQSVVIDDTTPPEVPVLADVFLGECSGTPPTPTAMDNCSGIVKGTTSILFPKTKQGRHTIIWTFDDGHGNVVTAYQNLILEDKTAPVPDVETLADVRGQCSVTTVTAPTATDNCKGKITATTTDPLAYSEQGNYTIHWTYEDGNGNTSTQTQNVVVDDTTPPEAPVLADVTLDECSGTPITPMTTDNCSGPIHGTTTMVFPVTTQGTTIVTWTFDDGNGNVTTAKQNVTVDGIPVAMDDIIAVDENSQITGNVTTNDKGLCDTPIRMNIITEPEFGSLTFSNDGSFKYIPNNNYSGKDKFTYQICDSDGDCSSATVEITINSVNDLPQANADTEDLQVDVTWHGNVAVNDVLSGDGNNVWTLDTHPSNGTILFNEDGTYTYTPYASFIGNDSFSYELCDANGDCSKAKVTIHVDDVLLPNQILSPNSDDHNDTFIINGIEYYPINKVTVYNRWGNIVYSKNNYQNEWDGVSKVSSKPLPVGTYYYLIDYGNNRHKTGFVYLDR